MKITYNNARVLGSIQEFQMAVYYYFQELAIKYTSQKTTSKNFTNNEISFMVALRPQASNGWTAAVKTAVEFTNKYTKGKRVQGTGKLSKHASLTRKPAQNEKSTLMCLWRPSRKLWECVDHVGALAPTWVNA